MTEPACTEQDLVKAQAFLTIYLNMLDCLSPVAEDGTQAETNRERHYANLAAEFSRIRREARAGMREACAKACIGYGHICNNKGCHAADAAAIGQISDLAADEAIERIREEAHEAALPLAAEQIIGALTEGGEFAEGSSLAKVMQAIERIKREARLDYDELKLAAWHARAMKLANEMEHYGHVTHYPAMCAKCRLLALLGDLK